MSVADLIVSRVGNIYTGAVFASCRSANKIFEPLWDRQRGVKPTLLSPGAMYGPSPDCKQIFDGEAVCANVCGFLLKRSICFEP